MIIVRVARLNESLRFRLCEWVLSGVLFSWGWILLLPTQSFDLPSLAGLRNIASENMWGSALLLLGAGRLVVLTINGAWRRNPHARGVGAFLSCFVWCQISLGLLNSGVVAPGIAVYPIFLIAEMYTVYRTSRDARESDEAWKNGGRT